jgi:hypothetical protein
MPCCGGYERELCPTPTGGVEDNRLLDCLGVREKCSPNEDIPTFTGTSMALFPKIHELGAHPSIGDNSSNFEGDNGNR